MASPMGFNPLLGLAALITSIPTYWQMLQQNQRADDAMDAFTGQLGMTRDQVQQVMQTAKDLPFNLVASVPGGVNTQEFYGTPTQNQLHAGAADMSFGSQAEYDAFLNQPTGTGQIANPYFGTDEQILFGSGDPNLPTINIDDLFNVGQTRLDTFNALKPGFEGATSASQAAIDEANSLFDQTTASAFDLLGLGTGGPGAPIYGKVGKDRRVIGFEQTDGPSFADRQIAANDRRFSGALANIEDILGGAKTSGAQILEGVEMPDTDLSDVLSARVAGVSDTARRNLQQAQRQGAANILSSGGNLENARRQQEGLGFQAANQLGTTTRQIAGDIRNQELAAQQFVSNLQAQAGGQAATINSALDQLLAQTQGNFATVGADLATQLRGQHANLLAGLGSNISGQTANLINQQVGVDTLNLDTLKYLTGTELGLTGEAATDDIKAFEALIGMSDRNNQIDAQGLNFLLGLDQILGAGTSGQFGTNIFDFTAPLQMAFQPNTPDPPNTLFGVSLD